jgi:hypothetical protein
MSIFGQLDAANIPTNPFWVDAGEYTAEVTDAKYKINKDGARQLIIEYTIDDDASEFVESRVAQFFTLVDPELTQEDLELLPAEEKRNIRRSNAALKRNLCGANGRKGLGVNQDDLNDPEWDPKSLIGSKVNVGVTNYGSNDEGVSVRWVNLRD